MKKHLFIAVTGTIGSGKTTASRLIAKHFRFRLIEENFGENAFLTRFYSEMKRWAFHSQTFFLMEKITQTFTVRETLERYSVVQDVPIYQDVYSYAKAQYVSGNMDDAEWRLYQKIFKALNQYLPKPDYIIYLKTSLDSVKKRIFGRSREFEQKVPEGYLELLDMLNETWMRKEGDGMKIITIETDKLNLARSKPDIRAFLNALKKEFGT